MEGLAYCGLVSTTSTARRRRVVKPSEVRRRELLAAARRLVARDGSTVAVGDIAAAARTATGNVYRYFGSKDELLAALKADVVEEMLERLVAHMRPDSDWWTGADALIEEMVDFWLGDRSRRALLVELGDFTRQAFDTSGRRPVDLVAAALRGGVERGAIAVDDPNLAASLIVHGVFGTLEHAAITLGSVDRPTLIAGVQSLVRKMLAPS